MARNLNKLVEEQLGGLLLQLMMKDLELEQLQEELKKLREQLPMEEK